MSASANSKENNSNAAKAAKPPKPKKRGRMRTQRYTSNVFSMFNQAQIQEFKEAFNMIDQNHDGFLDKEDLIEMLTSLGKNPSDDFLDEMVNQAPGPLNFTMFLTLFGEKMTGADPEDVILNAFGCFDETNKGVIPEERLRELMTTMGDRWTHDQVDDLFLGAPIKGGMFEYVDFVRTLKHGAGDKEEDQQAAGKQANQPDTSAANQSSTSATKTKTGTSAAKTGTSAAKTKTGTSASKTKT